MRVAAALLIGVLAATAAGLMAPSTAGASSWAPVHSGDFPDPDIIQWPGGVIGGPLPAGYYAFATQSTPPEGGSQINIQVSFSTRRRDVEHHGYRRPPRQRPRFVGRAGEHVGSERGLLPSANSGR